MTKVMNNITRVSLCWFLCWLGLYKMGLYNIRSMLVLYKIGLYKMGLYNIRSMLVLYNIGLYKMGLYNIRSMLVLYNIRSLQIRLMLGLYKFRPMLVWPLQNEDLWTCVSTHNTPNVWTNRIEKLIDNWHFHRNTVEVVKLEAMIPHGGLRF